MTNNIYKYDFLIIGSGLAGLYSAMYASKYGKVALLTKSSIKESSSYWAQGGIAAVMDSGDSFDDHFSDTLIAGQDLCNENNVRILVTEGKERIHELIKLGMKFDSSDNELLLGLEGGHSKRRILHAGGSETGKKVVQFVINEISENTNIHIYENMFVFELLSNGVSCFGAKAYNWKENKTYNFISPATILASGGLSGIFARSTNPHVSTGDGIALAYYAGAEIADLEFMQFHPTAFYSDSGATFLVSEAVRGEGAYLLNESFERFMITIDERAELAARDIVSKAIYEQIKKQKNQYVYLDARKIDKKYFETRFPNIYKNAQSFGFNLPEDLLPISPAAHYTIGGIKTDSDSSSNIIGLFACGETASNGIHGANRLASNSLLECLVFGKRAVQKAINNLGKSDVEIINDNFSIEKNNEESYIKTRNKVAVLLNDYAGILRDGKSLEYAIDELIKLKENSYLKTYEYYSIRKNYLLILAELIFQFALKRKESRGCHTRKDYPEIDNYFKGNYCTKIKSEVIFKPLN